MNKKIKEYKGQVIKNSMNKTIVVKTLTLKKHKIYKKYVKVVKKILVHDENNISKINDNIIFIQSRPLSKRKHFILTKVINHDTN